MMSLVSALRDQRIAHNRRLQDPTSREDREGSKVRAPMASYAFKAAAAGMIRRLIGSGRFERMMMMMMTRVLPQLRPCWLACR